MTQSTEPLEAFLGRLVDDGTGGAESYLVRRIPSAERTTLLRETTSPLVTAWANGSRVFSCWSHLPGSGFEVLVGGTSGFPVAPESEQTDGVGPAVPVLFPPGARAEHTGPAAPRLAQAVGAFGSWRRVGGFVERRHEPRGGEEPGALEDHASFLSHLAFALLCVAVPVERDGIEARRTELAARLLEAQRGLDKGAADRVIEGLGAEVEECTLAEAAGLWRVHLFAGARDSATVDQVAGIWGASAEHHFGPRYRLAAVGESQPLVEAAAAAVEPADALSLASPFYAGSGFLASVCRSPLNEVPGVEARTTNSFDVAVGLDGDVELGHVLDRSYDDSNQLRIRLPTFGMHTFVHGATGAGKSQATRHLLTEFTRRGIPWIVLEPAKSEYAAGMSERLDRIRPELPDPSLADVYVLRAGDPDATPVSISMLEPERGFHHQAHLDVVVDLATAAFDAESPFPEVFTQAVHRCTVAAGWDPALGEPLESLRGLARDGERPPFPAVDDLVRACHEVIDEKGYDQKVANNIHGFVDMRLGTLATGAKRVAFGAGYPLDFRAVLDRNLVLELQDLGTDADRALFMGLFLARLNEAVRVRDRDDPARGRIRNVVCVEEAHRLLRNPEKLSPAAARAVESFTDVLAEVRSRGVALVVAEQIPSKISPDVVKNTALKCMGRTPAQDDRDLVGAAMGLTDEQSEQVIALEPGQFAVHADGYDRPFLVRFPYHPEADDGGGGVDPAPLAAQLPEWYGSVRDPGVLTQRHVALADQLVGDPAFALFCELAVVAHLTGLPHPTVSPRRRSRFLHRLDESAPEAVRAAIGIAVGGASKLRATAFGSYLLPAFATTVADACERALAGEGISTDSRWMSRPYQFVAIRIALQERAGLGEPHPDTRRWVDEWGLRFLDEPTVDEQRSALRSSLIVASDDAAVAVLGPRRPSALERIAGRVSPDLRRGLKLTCQAFVPSLPEIGPLVEEVVGAADRSPPHLGRRSAQDAEQAG